MTEHPALTNLREHQRQLDADGIEVGVSRQALDEALAFIDQMAAPKPIGGRASRLAALADAYEPGNYALSDGVYYVYAHVPECCQTLRDDIRWALELALNQGEEFLEFKETLSDLRSLRQENCDLNGGGPGWSERWAATWAKVDELFADEDEAAWERAQEGAWG